MKEIIRIARQQVAISTLDADQCIVIHIPAKGLYKVAMTTASGGGFIATSLTKTDWLGWQPSIEELMLALFGQYPSAMAWVVENEEDFALLIKEYWKKW